MSFEYFSICFLLYTATYEGCSARMNFVLQSSYSKSVSFSNLKFFNMKSETCLPNKYTHFGRKTKISFFNLCNQAFFSFSVGYLIFQSLSRGTHFIRFVLYIVDHLPDFLMISLIIFPEAVDSQNASSISHDLDNLWESQRKYILESGFNFRLSLCPNNVSAISDYYITCSASWLHKPFFLSNPQFQKVFLLRFLQLFSCRITS